MKVPIKLFSIDVSHYKLALNAYNDVSWHYCILVEDYVHLESFLNDPQFLIYSSREDFCVYVEVVYFELDSEYYQSSEANYRLS
jgi:hypothetical protein